VSYVKKNEFFREVESGRTRERTKRGMKMRGENSSPVLSLRWSELLAQRTPPSVHSSREFNAPGRTAIKTCRGSSRDLPRARLVRSRCWTRSWLLIVPLERERPIKGEMEATHRIYMEQCLLQHCDLEKTCRVQRETISRLGRLSRRGDPLNCLLTLPSMDLMVRPGAMGALLTLDLEN